MIAINMELHRMAVWQTGSTQTEEEINPIYHGTAQILSSFPKNLRRRNPDIILVKLIRGYDKIWEVKMYKPENHTTISTRFL